MLSSHKLAPTSAPVIALIGHSFRDNKTSSSQILKKIQLGDLRDHLDRYVHRDTKQSVHSEIDFFGVSRNLDISELFMKILELVLFKPDSHRRGQRK